MGAKTFEPINVQPTRAELIARAEYVGKLAESEALEADRNSRVSDRVVQAIQETELNKLLRPQRYGGPSFDIWTYKEAIRTVIRHNVAAGWLTLCLA